MATIINTPSSKCSKNKFLLLVSLVVFVVVLCLSLFVVYGFVVSGDGGVVFVWSEGGLRRAVVDVDGVGGSTVVVVLCCDVFLSRPLVVGEGCNVTLTSRGDGFFRLVGVAEGKRVIVVEEGGWLMLDGVVITHKKGVVGGGVVVKSGGEFVLVSGEISGNTAAVDGGGGGGGVVNYGVFRMFGGEVSNNKAVERGVISNPRGGVGTSWVQSGGGVKNFGVFEMYGGSIADNFSISTGGGVCNYAGGVYTVEGVSAIGVGNFSMFGGSITHNTAGGVGGGVSSEGDFVMYSGVISNNAASGGGGGVGNYRNFSMFGGSITHNTVNGSLVGRRGGGVYSYHGGVVVFEGGEVVNNECKGGNGNNIYVEDKAGNVVLVR